MQTKEKDKKKNKLIIILSIVIVVLLAVGTWFFFFKQPDKIIPDYVKESNAQEMGDDDSKKMEKPDGGGAVSLLYSKNVKVNLSDSRVSLFVGNPKKSTQDIVLQVLIDENVIAQSGRLVPGYQVDELTIDKNAKTILTKGGYKGKIKIFYFDETGGKKAMLNTEIPVSIEVNE